MITGEVVRLASAGSLGEAHAWRAALQQAGIRCRVVGDYLTAGLGSAVPNMSPEVWVQREDLEKAEKVLREQHFQFT